MHLSTSTRILYRRSTVSVVTRYKCTRSLIVLRWHLLNDYLWLPIYRKISLSYIGQGKRLKKLTPRSAVYSCQYNFLYLRVGGIFGDDCKFLGIRQRSNWPLFVLAWTLKLHEYPCHLWAWPHDFLLALELPFIESFTNTYVFWRDISYACPILEPVQPEYVLSIGLSSFH